MLESMQVKLILHDQSSNNELMGWMEQRRP
jgi:hypothetical protein